MHDYLTGKKIFEKLFNFVEDIEDTVAVKSTNYTKTRDFEKIAKELGL